MSAVEHSFTIAPFRQYDPTPQIFYVWDSGWQEQDTPSIREFDVRPTPCIPGDQHDPRFHLRIERVNEKQAKIAWVSAVNDVTKKKYEEVSGKGIPNFLLPEVAKRCEAVICSGTRLRQKVSGVLADYEKRAAASKLALDFGGGNQRSPEATDMWDRLKAHLEAHGDEFRVEYDGLEDTYRLLPRPTETRKMGEPRTP
jgi:hypothetical protein